MSYKQARSDFEYLESLAELTDQVELDSARLDLMRNPSKLQAQGMYESGIEMWFREHGENYGHDKKVRKIAYRHGIEF